MVLDILQELESGYFKWPQKWSREYVSVSERQFPWLRDGLSIDQEIAHKPVFDGLD